MEDLRSLVITKLSAKDLKDVQLFGRMKVYAIASITGGHSTGHQSQFTTSIDKKRKTNPKWKTPIEFKIHAPSLRNNCLYLDINLHCSCTFGDRHVGGVRVPVKRLVKRDSANNRTNSRAMKFPMERASGRKQGFVKFTYVFQQTLGGQQAFSQQQSRPRPQRPPSMSGQYHDPLFQSQFEFSLQQQGQVSPEQDPFGLGSSTSHEQLYNQNQSNDYFMGATQAYDAFDDEDDENCDDDDDDDDDGDEEDEDEDEDCGDDDDDDWDF